MSTMDLTIILDDLAAGRIDAAEAKRRIGALESTGPAESSPEMSTEWPTMPEAGAETPATGPVAPEPNGNIPPKADKINGVSKILVRATGRKVKIVADPNVSTAAAEDVHQVKRNGSTLEILGDKEFSGVVDAIAWARSLRGLDDVKALGIGKELTVRVNPTLEVDIELTGSSLHVQDLPHLGRVRLTAGVATITGAHVVSDLLLQAGQATLSGQFTQGWSRVRCESGQIVVEAAPGSDVTVRADAQLGRVSWDGGQPTDNELVLGAGTAHLDIGIVVGHGVVKVL
ncbi:MAG: hypothetical protein LBV06_06880 [Propionibacteriaceae bacterium]|jgi:hypothetical protein|nr:hypothetical protein [Propionibacteriaceae bacterium]